MGFPFVIGGVSVSSGGGGDVGPYIEPTVFSPTEDYVMPGLDPTVRTAAVAQGYVDIEGPGYASGTAIMRRSVATFDNQATAGRLNTCLFEGWNYNPGGAQIDPTQGSIGWGIENSYNPSGSNVWGEYHNRFTRPGGNEQRPWTFYGQWSDGYIGAGINASIFNVNYQIGSASPVTTVAFGSNQVILPNGVVLYSNWNNQAPFLQLNAAGNAYYRLPYWFDDVCYLGSTGSAFRPTYLFPWLDARTSAAAGTPASGAYLYWDSTLGDIAIKTTDGSRYTLNKTLAP